MYSFGPLLGEVVCQKYSIHKDSEYTKENFIKAGYSD